MTPRRRLATAFVAFAVLAAVVAALRHAQSGSTGPPAPPPVSLADFTAPHLLVPNPGEPPAAPAEVEAFGGHGWIRVAWGSALPGGQDPAHAAGYEVSWHRDGEPARTRRVASSEVQLDGLAEGVDHRIAVRTVDAVGRRSPAVETTGRVGDDGDWRDGLTGLLDDFDDPATTDARRSGSLWHVDGYRGCVNTDNAGGHLLVEMNCGADSAVLRARRPLVLSEVDDDVLGRVGVVTDAAGARGGLTVDLVPGGPDQVGSEEVSDPALPPGAVRVALDDDGARVLAAPDVPTVPDRGSEAATRRGTGVLHRFDVLLTKSGVRVLQDGRQIGSSGAVPAWREATVLLGLRGARGRRSTVRLDAAGFSGAQTPVRGVVETPTVPATQQVLDLDDQAPGVGISRAPLRGATAARLRATVTFAGPVDPAAVVVQLGDARLPAVQAAPAPVVAGVVRQGTAITVVAELPPELLAETGPDSLSPFVLRVAGGRAAMGTVRSSYLEVDTTTTEAPPATTGRPRSTPADELPAGSLVVRDQNNQVLPPDQPLGQRRVVLSITLDPLGAEAVSGSVAGVAGFRLRIDGQLAATVNTARDGPGLGGTYTVGLELGRLPAGRHRVELEVVPVDPAERERSTLVTLEG
ncbi:hypothetical protein [Umezawaea sp.]|uniref:hypothetical protein n=1 Tax=Umezawaea sp. TaxID=1955258 RepID=UPI002ED558D6